MTSILYLVLLVSFLILEKNISDTARYRGILLAIFVLVLGFILNSKFIWLAIILASVNLGRFVLRELYFLKLTSLKERLANVLEFETRFD